MASWPCFKVRDNAENDWGVSLHESKSWQYLLTDGVRVRYWKIGFEVIKLGVDDVIEVVRRLKCVVVGCC